jgi:hypothetical protein
MAASETGGTTHGLDQQEVAQTMAKIWITVAMINLEKRIAALRFNQI